MASTTIAMPRPSQVGGRLGKMRVSHTRGRRGVARMQAAPGPIRSNECSNAVTNAVGPRLSLTREHGRQAVHGKC